MKVEEIKIGTPVTYYSRIDEATGEKLNPQKTFITSKPCTLGHGRIACEVDGVPHGVLISHLEKREIIVNKKPEKQS